MQLELRFFASFREAVGQKVLEREYDIDRVRVGDVLHELADEYGDLDFFAESGELREYVSVMKNGRDVTHLDGLDTALGDGDKLSVFPPIAGG
jgi:molybdopterin synthase sulfur carrier subunit